MQTVTFTGSVSSDGDVIGDFWYEYQNRGSRYAPQTGTSYELTLSNPPAGAYQLCWSHTTAGPQKATGTITTTVLDGAALTVTKALVDIVPGEGVLIYELVVTNHGPGKAIDVILKDTLPFGVQVDSIGPYDGSPQELSADQTRASFRVDDVDVSSELSDLEGQPIVSCHLGDLEVGQAVAITIRVLLMGKDTGTIRNHIAVSAANGIAPFEDDADAVETSIDFWGEPIATCSLEITWRALVRPGSAGQMGLEDAMPS
jgi:uncharacterized repeat protein (TIGR01451 family)